MVNTFIKRPVHVGRNIQWYRILKGYSQAGLAQELEKKHGKSVSQQLISDLEDRESAHDENMLKEIAEILGTTPEILKTVDLESAVNVVSNNFTDNQFAGYTININPIFHPVDQMLVLFAEEKAELRTQIALLRRELDELKSRS